MKNNRKLILGQEYIVDLPGQNGSCLAGKHHCIIIKRFGSTVQVVPISTNRNNIHYGEVPVDSDTHKQLKLKIGQLTSVSIDKIGKYIGRVNNSILKAIKDFIRTEIVDFIDKKVI